MEDTGNGISTRNLIRNFIFTGVFKAVGTCPEININITCDSASTLNTMQVFINYSNDLVNIKQETYVIGNVAQYNIRSRPLNKYFNVSIINGLNNIINFNMATSLQLAVGYTEPEDVTINGVVSVSNFPATQAVTGIFYPVTQPVSIASAVAVTGTFFQPTQPVSGTVEVTGAEPQYMFYATPATNTVAVYADGAQGVTVNGGWLFENTSSNKINWYVYANTVSQASTAKKLEDIKDMYMVIYQKPTEVSDIKNPFIAFYSLPEAVNNTSWYKNRYVYTNYDDASEVGTKLLYIGLDNPLIHPEITKRIKLDWDPISSTNTLEAGANETLWLSTVQTASNTDAGKYNFVFSEFGLNFNELALNLTVLPIIDNKVQVSISNFPAEQAVTGSFYQLTQPVSIATPVAVTGSFYPDTQAVTIATAIDTNIKTIDTAITFQCQERPTTESYFTTAVGTGGIAITMSPKTLRNFSINTTSAVIVYVYLYDTGVFPTSGDTPIFVFPIMNANNIIFNSFDHRFIHGIGIRATTTYNGVISPPANTVFVNMTISE